MNNEDSLANADVLHESNSIDEFARDSATINRYPVSYTPTQQACVASIVTDDDANPLSENGDSPRTLAKYQSQISHQSASKPMRTFHTHSFSDLKISNAKWLFQKQKVLTKQ